MKRNEDPNTWNCIATFQDASCSDKNELFFLQHLSFNFVFSGIEIILKQITMYYPKLPELK